MLTFGFTGGLFVYAGIYIYIYIYVYTMHSFTCTMQKFAQNERVQFLFLLFHIVWLSGIESIFTRRGYASDLPSRSSSTFSLLVLLVGICYKQHAPEDDAPLSYQAAALSKIYYLVNRNRIIDMH
jgi:hypothetical protein